MLPAGAARFARLPIELALRDHEHALADVFEDRDGDRARVHAAALLGGRHALPAMAACLGFEDRTCTAPRDPQLDLPGPRVDDPDAKATSALRAGRRYRPDRRRATSHPHRLRPHGS